MPFSLTPSLLLSLTHLHKYTHSQIPPPTHTHTRTRTHSMSNSHFLSPSLPFSPSLSCRLIPRIEGGDKYSQSRLRAPRFFHSPLLPLLPLHSYNSSFPPSTSSSSSFPYSSSTSYSSSASLSSPNNRNVNLSDGRHTLLSTIHHGVYANEHLLWHGHTLDANSAEKGKNN
jgi:hypothetical protein